METVTFKGINSLIKKFNNVSNLSEVKDTMVKAIVLVHAQAKTLAPAGNTGNLRGSIHQEVKEKKNSIEGRVFTNVQYAPYVEFGTGSKGNGTYPKKDISLSYRDTPWVYTPDGGENFYRTNGQVAHPFMYPAIKQNEKKIKNMFKEALKNNLKGGK